MKAKNAGYLYIGEQIEWNDGRIAIIQQNDTTKREIRMRFQNDGTVTICPYGGLIQAELIKDVKKR